MSAVIGIFRLDGQTVDRSDLGRMVTSVAGRGPDGVGLWSAEQVGFGQCLLRTTPESLQEKLPLPSRSGDVVLTADARIDNRNELISELELTDHAANEITDSQLILEAYEKWGERCVEKLVGDFAIAIWNGRRQAIFCARDHFGVKPFYYHQSEKIFVFASEIKALLCLPEVPRRLNETRVGEYLSDVFDDKAATFYQGIFRLPPGHFMTVRREGVCLRPYWSLDTSRELRLGSDAEYAEAFRELFTEAVRCRLRSAFPVGTTLSGGLDSSSITCVARELLAQDGGRKLRTFSAVFDDVPECDERPFINTVLARNGVEPHFVRADRLSPLAEWERILRLEDEPFYAPNLYMHWGLYSAARQQGVRVFLDGLDGDTTVSHGQGYLNELARTGHWLSLAAEVKGYARQRNRSPSKMLWKYLWQDGLKPLAPDSLRQIRQAFRRQNPSASGLDPLINMGFARRIGLQECVLASRTNGRGMTAREVHYRQLTHGILPFILEVADRAAAAFSLEPRYPFFDKRLVEFCLALPPLQKLHRGWTRVILRRAMGGILPPEIQWRSGKANLGANFHRGLLDFDRELVEEVIVKNPDVLSEYIDLTALREFYRHYVNEAGKVRSNELGVWKALTLALWLRHTGLIP